MGVLVVVILSIVALIVGSIYSSKKPTKTAPPKLVSNKRVKIDLSQYFAVMTPAEYDNYEKSILNGTDHSWLTESRKLTLDKRLKVYLENDNLLKNVALLNNQGIALENAGKIDEAISVYESNIQSRYPAAHSYDRLMILYRKDKRYLEELRVIETALQVFNDNSKYQDRLKKTVALINKHV